MDLLTTLLRAYTEYTSCSYEIFQFDHAPKSFERYSKFNLCLIIIFDWLNEDFWKKHNAQMREFTKQG